MACGMGGSVAAGTTNGSTSNDTTNNTSGTANSSSNSTTTAINPDWVSGGAQGLAANILGLGGANPSNYFAPASGNQMLAYNNATGASDLVAPQLSAATQGAAGATAYQPQQVTAQTAAGGIGQYMNPFQSSVAGTTLQQLDQANKLALNDVNQGAALAGGYGGSRQGVAQGLTNNQFANQAANALSNLNLQGYNTALVAAENDANRALQAQEANQQAGIAGQGVNLAGAGLLSNLAQNTQNNLASTGATQQSLAQQQASAPLTVNQAIQQMFSGLPLNLFNGQSNTSNTQGSYTGLDNTVSNGTSNSTQAGGSASFG